MRILLSIKEIFDSDVNFDVNKLNLFFEKELSFEYLLFISDISKRCLLERKQIDILKYWLEKTDLNDIERDSIISNFFKNKRGIIFQNITNNKILLKLLNNRIDFEPNKKIAKSEYTIFLKIYLFINHQINEKHYKIFKNRNGEDSKGLMKLKFTEVFLPTFHGELQYKPNIDPSLQYYRSEIILNFLKEKIQNLYKTFLEKTNMTSGEDYRINLSKILLQLKEEDNCVLRVGEENIGELRLIQNLTLNNLLDSISPIKLIHLRNKPILNLFDNNFLFMSISYLTDRIYTGLKFLLKDIVEEKTIFFNDKKIPKGTDFFSFYGREIAEPGLFEYLIEKSFNSKSNKILSGSLFEKYDLLPPPDFYIRDKGKIFLFEFKDSIIPDNIKGSYEFSEIKGELFKKLLRSNSSKDKGIKQLINVISNLNHNEYKDLDDIEGENIVIFPILVFSDSYLDTPCINYLLNHEFKNILGEYNINTKIKIRDLTLINIDFFVKYCLNLREKSIKFNYLINRYHLENTNCFKRYYINELDKNLNHLKSFHDFIEEDMKITPKFFN
ncbi:hypothetical protein [Mangrovivirga cuniculi]|uniref:Uncharacterized protein n=1 Tax=Mangrovivirga cuniculi TaxID=2715131 RepID=A0A4D7JR37_9BACT|nr:hypothetical protein [Mangrovivirga cuniculi]QCK15222.1 hypothetical protein DCC35_10930 [Mangrovivirga cuniculi]